MKWVKSVKTVGILSACCHAAQGRGRFQGQIARHCTDKCEETLREKPLKFGPVELREVWARFGQMNELQISWELQDSFSISPAMLTCPWQEVAAQQEASRTSSNHPCSILNHGPRLPGIIPAIRCQNIYGLHGWHVRVLVKSPRSWRKQ